MHLLTVDTGHRTVAFVNDAAGTPSEKAEELLSAVEQISWPTKELESLGVATAITAGELLASERHWVRRRVEDFSFVDGVRVRRAMSTDLYLPLESEEGPIIVPLALPRKVELRNLDVRDERGAAIPVLTRTENASISAALLIIQAEEVLQELERVGPLEPDVVTDLRHIAGDLIPAKWVKNAPITTSRNALDRVRNPPGNLGDRSLQQRRALWTDANMRTYMQLLAERFLFLVRLVGAPGDRRVVKMSYEEDVARADVVRGPLRLSRWRVFRFMGKWRVFRSLSRWRVFRLLALVRRDWRQSIGIEPFTVIFPTRGLYAAASYHAELEVDDDLLISHAELGRAIDFVNVSTGERDSQGHQDLRHDGKTHRAHVYVPGIEVGDEVGVPPDGFEVAESGYLTCSITLRPGVVFGPAVVAAVTTLMLAVGFCLKAAGAHTDHDLTLILLAIPALFAAYLVPTARQALVRRLYGLLRLSVLISAAIALLATIAVALALSKTAVLVWWGLLALCSAALSWPLWWAFAKSLDRARKP